jgi:hypothetical protein
MSYRSLLVGVAALAILAAVGAYAVIVTLFDDVDDVDMEIGDAFVEAYFCPELLGD